MAPKNLSGFREALANRSFDVALADVTPPGDPDLYDFWSQEAVVRGQNYAGWNNRRASEALEQARQIWSDEQRLPLYQAFLGYYDSDLPALTLFQYVYNYGLSDAVHEAEVGLIENPRERYQTLASWFLLFREVLVGCPEDESS
jgi:ABC-type transport system substrate-binding protein